MKIGIDTLGCDHGRSGIGAYILSLVHNLPKTEHSIQLFGHELDKYTYTSGVEGVKYTCVSVGDSAFAEQAWHRLSFNAFARKQKYDIVLFPSGTKLLPMRFEAPSVLVIQNILSGDFQGYLKDISSFVSKLTLKFVRGIIRIICLKTALRKKKYGLSTTALILICFIRIICKRKKL